jgi:peptidoglycan/LPS O-acetylase OafA/YrhL
MTRSNKEPGRDAGYADAAADDSLDAAEWDALLNVVGRHFTGRLWPRTGGMVATGWFMADLQRVTARAGRTVDLLAMA